MALHPDRESAPRSQCGDRVEGPAHLKQGAVTWCALSPAPDACHATPGARRHYRVVLGQADQEGQSAGEEEQGDEHEADRDRPRLSSWIRCGLDPDP